MGYLGSHSGRDENKIEAVGFTSVKMGQVSRLEAECTFLCKKLYQHQFSRRRFGPKSRILCGKTRSLSDFKGGWQPHCVFVGEIIDVRKKKKIMLNNETFMKFAIFYISEMEKRVTKRR